MSVTLRSQVCSLSLRAANSSYLLGISSPGHISLQPRKPPPLHPVHSILPHPSRHGQHVRELYASVTTHPSFSESATYTHKCPSPGLRPLSCSASILCGTPFLSHTSGISHGFLLWGRTLAPSALSQLPAPQEAPGYCCIPRESPL